MNRWAACSVATERTAKSCLANRGLQPAICCPRRSRQRRSVPEYQVACRYAIHLDRCAPGAAGYFRHRYSLVAQPGTSKLGDTCRCWPAPSELSEPAACRLHRAPSPSLLHVPARPRGTYALRPDAPAMLVPAPLHGPLRAPQAPPYEKIFLVIASPSPLFHSLLLHHTPSVNLCFRATHRRLSSLNCF